MHDNCIPVDDLLALIAQLRAAPPGPHPGNASLRRWMAAVVQGREQAAKRLEDLLAKYGVEIEREHAE